MRRKLLLRLLLPWLLLNVVCILSYVGNPLVASITVIYSYEEANDTDSRGAVISGGNADPPGPPPQKQTDLQITFAAPTAEAPSLRATGSPERVVGQGDRENNKELLWRNSRDEQDYEIMERSHTLGDRLGASSADFPINQVDICQNGMFLLIVVCSAVENFERRTAIRRTWGAIAKNEPAAQVGLLFLLGRPSVSFSNHSKLHSSENTSLVLDKVLRENELHSDILQADFTDSYRNLSIKSVFMLQWMSEFCAEVKFALKADDDMFVNVPNLLRDLHMNTLSRFIMGHIIAAAQPMRSNTSKWYTPESQFNGTWYPTYISGSAYVISGDIIHDLYNATKNVKLFWLEDVYITGMCLKSINAKHVYNGKFGYLKRSSNPCVFKHVVTGHRMTPRELYKMWSYLHNKNIKCDHTRISLIHRF